VNAHYGKAGKKIN